MIISWKGRIKDIIIIIHNKLINLSIDNNHFNEIFSGLQPSSAYYYHKSLTESYLVRQDFMQNITIISQSHSAIWGNTVHVNVFINVHHKFSLWMNLKKIVITKILAINLHSAAGVNILFEIVGTKY